MALPALAVSWSALAPAAIARSSEAASRPWVDRGYALAGGDCGAQLGRGEHRQRPSAIGEKPAMKK
jgi:hypothetical protein